MRNGEVDVKIMKGIEKLQKCHMYTHSLLLKRMELCDDILDDVAEKGIDKSVICGIRLMKVVFDVEEEEIFRQIE